MKLKVLTLALLTSNMTFADTIFGIYAGAQTWYYDYSGNFDIGSNSYDFQDDFLNNKEYSNSFFVAIEHPLPLVPNVKLKHTSFDNLGSQKATCPTVEPNFCSFDASLNLSHTDITLYYELLDNWVNLDLGLSAIYFTGNSQFDLSGNLPVIENYSEFIPALYARAMFEIPITDLSISVTGNLSTFSDNTIFDVEIAAQYKFALGFSLEAGLRQQTIDFEGFNNIQVRSDATGVFAGLNFHF